MPPFAAPPREQSRARRERTNTPLQALLTMNDPQYFEAARQLGYRMLHEGGTQDADRLRFGFRLATCRAPEEKECAVLEKSLAAQRARYEVDLEAAKKVLSIGESPAPSDVPPPELAAYTMVANLLLNLEEEVTKNYPSCKTLSSTTKPAARSSKRPVWLRDALRWLPSCFRTCSAMQQLTLEPVKPTPVFRDCPISRRRPAG